MQLFGSLWWDGAQDCFMGLRGGFEKHCTRASLRSDTVEDLIRLSVEGPSLEDVDARESVLHVACRAHFLQSRERLSEDPTPLAHTLSATR